LRISWRKVPTIAFFDVFEIEHKSIMKTCIAEEDRGGVADNR
jgi:hypothetical protein